MYIDKIAEESTMTVRELINVLGRIPGNIPILKEEDGELVSVRRVKYKLVRYGKLEEFDAVCIY